MTNMRVLLAAVALAAGVPAVADAATTINFDTGPASGAVAATYAAQGVTFTGTNFVDLSAFGLAGASGTRGINASSGGFIITDAAPIRGSFTSAVTTVGIRGLNVGLDGIRIEAFNAANQLVGFDEFIGPQFNTAASFRDLTVSGAGITRFAVFQPRAGRTGNGVLFDNLTFDAAVAGVPEPATWAMMIAGFGVIGAGARRRKPATTLA